MSTLRGGLPALPQRMQHLPIDARGYPIPWFVADLDGVRDFRVADAAKRARAVKQGRCWVCGLPRHGREHLFVIGPMCVVNRVTSEPAVHPECAEFAVRACPFMLYPEARYRDVYLPEGVSAPGILLKRNPGVMALYTCASFQPEVLGLGLGWLIRLGEPSAIVWYTNGRPAKRREILASINGGMEHLRKLAEEDGGRAPLELDYAYQNVVMEWVPA